MNVGIINVTGYAGVELARILCHHPDANGGCPASEERMKSITRAYRVLHEALSAAPAR